MYSVEKRKRGLPHAHTLIWLVERIQPDQIDDVICGGIIDHEADPDLHDIVITNNMIHGPRNFEMNELHNRALLLIEDMCYIMCDSLFVGLGMPNCDINDAFNRELERKRKYDLIVQTMVKYK